MRENGGKNVERRWGKGLMNVGLNFSLLDPLYRVRSLWVGHRACGFTRGVAELLLGPTLLGHISFVLT
ncbi:hypothetical protein LINGRAHAP2_LOCUS34560, partial [Linum grandiflorum]